MQKIRFFLILFVLPISLLAQQRTKIFLQSSTRGTTVKDISYLRNPVFQHAGAVLSCDSAVYYEKQNVFEAFDNVHIVQGDTINIYSTRLTYNGNTKIAHLTDNVRMIDKESILTTNILDYNMGIKVGTYVQGGKIVNKDVTLTSKNGYYFSNTRDAYFRYNVVVVTPQSTIKSDSLVYNTLTNWAFFHGPTNISGKGDNLYTEDGAYNTKTEYAYFGKKNLYTNGSKSLKGDSLYYDGIAGYGKAIRNIVFKDTSDKTILYGQKGMYYKIDERAVVTKNAYVGQGTKDSIKINNKLQPDTIWIGADTLVTQMVLQKTLKLIEFPILKKDNELGEEEGPEEPKIGAKPRAAARKPEPVASSAAPKKLSKQEKKEAAKLKDSVSTDSIGIKKPDIVSIKDSIKLKIPDSTLKKANLATIKDSIKVKIPDSVLKKANLGMIKDSLKVKIPDSTLKKVDSLAKKTDSLIKKTIDPQKAKAVVSAKAKDAAAAISKPGAVKDLLKKPGLNDSLPVNPLDTIKARSIKAFHNVRVYKSNMQAVADSLFYTSADSTLRWYGSPIIWSQGSQQTGDTIHLRLKNNKLNTLQVLKNGFLVNVNADSAKFNQVKGKLITAFFNDKGELMTMFVDGNAESVYNNRREKDSVYIEMSQTVSSRIKVLFKNKEIHTILNIKDTEGIKVPIAELKADVILTGFIWKPELRPLSKKEVINGKAKPKGKAATAVKKIISPTKSALTPGKKATEAPAAPSNRKTAAKPGLSRRQ
ncbi:OstA-like protein [Pedobacter metabolipauper]|uniref:OstA-like protein n=1 Tax=Pedobacter metabolipauper TaxID=425513 RepID=A0A4R6STD3_9SPHI|nr:OstA-like protein [Pedobacter metabolipauper]TDQ07675.1 OstA-like protein [Pedobacter metabolipauper]